MEPRGKRPLLQVNIKEATLLITVLRRNFILAHLLQFNCGHGLFLFYVCSYAFSKQYRVYIKFLEHYTFMAIF